LFVTARKNLRTELLAKAERYAKRLVKIERKKAREAEEKEWPAESRDYSYRRNTGQINPFNNTAEFVGESCYSDADNPGETYRTQPRAPAVLSARRERFDESFRGLVLAPGERPISFGGHTILPMSWSSFRRIYPWPRQRARVLARAAAEQHRLMEEVCAELDAMNDEFGLAIDIVGDRRNVPGRVALVA
jgi:hypothetical protein